MSTVRERAQENAVGIVSILVFCAGLVALFVGFNFFWLIWTVGYPVLLPLVAILTSDDEDESDETSFEHSTHPSAKRSNTNADSTPNALATLRNRYARGELTDDQFERKLDALLETEHPESAAEWRTREHERVEERS
jgi:uncharacterized membrane protein